MNELEKKKKELEALIEQLENKQDMEEIQKIFPGHPELVKFLYEETEYNNELTYFSWDVESGFYCLEKVNDKFQLTETHFFLDEELSLNLGNNLDELADYILNIDLLPEIEIKISAKIKTRSSNIDKIKQTLRDDFYYEVE